MTTTQSLRQERRALTSDLRSRHKTWVEVADAFVERYGVNKRVAFRLAHDWSQQQAADAWNERWPTAPKTFKNFSYWEQWPASTGYAPSLDVVARLAELYHCSVADLLTDCPDFRLIDSAQHTRSQLALLDAEFSAGDLTSISAMPSEPQQHGLDKLVSHLEGLNIEELANTIRAWMAHADPTMARRDLLLRVSAALSLASSALSNWGDDSGQSTQLETSGLDLSGIWLSQYTYYSSGRTEEFHGEHRVQIRRHGDRLSGRSLSQDDESRLRLNLSMAGAIATGSWTERTSLSGYYKGATYHGTLQLIVSPMGRTMSGRWLGFNKEFKVNSGEWQLTWIEDSSSASGHQHKQ